MKKNILMTIGLSIIVLMCLPIFVKAFPPEWICAGGDRVTVGSTDSGSYANTYSYDLSYHIIESERGGTFGPWEAIVYYDFGGVKCSKVKIYAMLDPLHYGNPFQAWAYYSDDSNTYLGIFNPYTYKEFNLNTVKYLEEIKIRYYLSSGLAFDRYVKIDYIRCYTTGQP